MSTTISKKRVALPLTERDQRDLDLLKGSPAHRAALGHIVSVDFSGTPSEAALVHAVWKAGVQALEHQIEEEGYAALAADSAERRQHVIASRRRRRPDWADEE